MAQYAATLQHHNFDFGEPLLPPGTRVVDAGNLPQDDEAPVTRLRIAEVVGCIVEAGAVPLVLDGDDSVRIPLHGAFAGRGSFTILQIDAHIVFRDEIGGERLGL